MRDAERVVGEGKKEGRERREEPVCVTRDVTRSGFSLRSITLGFIWAIGTSIRTQDALRGGDALCKDGLVGPLLLVLFLVDDGGDDDDVKHLHPHLHRARRDLQRRVPDQLGLESR